MIYMCGCECDCNKEELFIECPSCGEVAVVIDVFGEGDYKVYACGNCADAGNIDEIVEPVFLEEIKVTNEKVRDFRAEIELGFISEEEEERALEELMERSYKKAREVNDFMAELELELEEMNKEEEEEERAFEELMEKSNQMSREINEYMADEDIDPETRLSIIQNVVDPICKSHAHIAEEVNASLLIALGNIFPYDRKISKGEFLGDYFIQPDDYFDYVWSIFVLYMTHRNEGLSSMRITNCVNAINVEVYQ